MKGACCLPAMNTRCAQPDCQQWLLTCKLRMECSGGCQGRASGEPSTFGLVLLSNVGMVLWGCLSPLLLQSQLFVWQCLGHKRAVMRQPIWQHTQAA